MQERVYTRKEDATSYEQVMQIAASKAWHVRSDNPGYMQIEIDALTQSERTEMMQLFSSQLPGMKKSYRTAVEFATKPKPEMLVVEQAVEDGPLTVSVPMELYKGLRRATPFLTVEEKRGYTGDAIGSDQPRQLPEKVRQMAEKNRHFSGEEHRGSALADIHESLKKNGVTHTHSPVQESLVHESQHVPAIRNPGITAIKRP